MARTRTNARGVRSPAVISFRRGSRVSGVDRAAVERELSELYARHGGHITPEIVARAARNRRSALHPFIFRKSDAAAAWEYRVEMARQLISAVYVRHVGREAPEPMYVCVSDGPETVGHYKTMVEAMSDEHHRATVLQRAYAELQAFQRKYRRLQAFRPVFTAIERVGRTVARESRTTPRRRRA